MSRSSCYALFIWCGKLVSILLFEGCCCLEYAVSLKAAFICSERKRKETVVFVSASFHSPLYTHHRLSAEDLQVNFLVSLSTACISYNAALWTRLFSLYKCIYLLRYGCPTWRPFAERVVLGSIRWAAIHWDGAEFKHSGVLVGLCSCLKIPVGWNQSVARVLCLGALLDVTPHNLTHSINHCLIPTSFL